jgi:hypothetical protein
MKNSIKQIMFMSGGGGGVTYETPSYSHALGSDNRAALNGKITTSGATMWGFVNTDPNYLVDGNKVADNIYPNNAIDVANEWLMIDFTGQASPTYKADKIKFYYGGTADGGVWKIQAYIGAAWVDVSASYTMYAANPQEIALTGAEGFTKLRQFGISGTSAWQYFREIEFSIGGEA